MKRLYFLLTLSALATHDINAMSGLYSRQLSSCARQAARSLIANGNKLPQEVKNAITNFSTTDAEALKCIIDRYPKAAQAFVQPAIDNLSTTHSSVLNQIIEHCPHAKNIFTDHISNGSNSFYPFKDLINCPPTQSKQHLLANLINKYQQLSSQGKVNYQDEPALQAMTKEVIDLEHTEQQKGRYTFLHGQIWTHHFYQEIYTDLWRLFNCLPPSSRFIRYKNNNPSRCAEKESEMRQKLMHGEGEIALMHMYEDGRYQYHNLFVNYALFTSLPGENTAWYIKKNRSEAPPSLHNSLFSREFQLTKYLDADELNYVEITLKELQHEHVRLSPYGAGLLLSLTPEMMQQCVFPCKVFGRKCAVNIEGIGETYDPKVILDTLRTTPEKVPQSDEIQFVCVLTHDLALKPNNGLDIYEFNAADKVKLAAWREKKNELMAWIKERVDRKR